MDELVTTSEAAGIIHVTPRRVRQWVTSGDLQPARTVRGAVLLRKLDVESFASKERPKAGWPRGKRRKHVSPQEEQV